MKKTKDMPDDWYDMPERSFHSNVAQGVIEDEEDLDTTELFLIGFTAG